MTIRVRLAWGLALGASMVTGCGSSGGRRDQIARDYQQTAETKFRDTQAALAATRLLEPAFKEELQREREAFSQRKKIGHARVLTPVNYGYGASGFAERAEIWAALALDRDGAVREVALLLSAELPPDAAWQQRLKEELRAWRFSSQTVDGVAIESSMAFPLKFDGREIRVRSRKELPGR